MSDKFELQSPHRSTGFLMWVSGIHWQRGLRKSLSPFSITPTEFVVLASAFYLTSHKENVTQTDISNQIGIDKMLTSKVLKELIKKDLIKRQEHSTDTRAKTITLNESGIETLKKAFSQVQKFESEFFSKIENPRAFNSELVKLIR